MSPKDWESSIDEQIHKAMERGDFDNLPGKGKPLDLTPNPYALEQELAFKILKDAGYAPEWIEIDKEIRFQADRAVKLLASRWARHQEQLNDLAGHTDSWAEAERKRSRAGWHEAITSFEEEIATINAKIAGLNLKVPSSRFQRFKIDAAREIARITGDEP